MVNSDNPTPLQDRKMNRSLESNSLCVVSLTVEMTLISTTVSFILPGIAIIISNIGQTNSTFLIIFIINLFIGLIIVGSRLCKSDRFRYRNTPGQS